MKKSPTIRTRKRGEKWYYSFEAGIVDGKRKQVSKGGFLTEADAEEAGMEAYVAWKHGNIGIVSEKITLADFLHSWLENAIRPNVKRNTYINYKIAIDARIIPHIGSIAIQELRPLYIDQWITKLAKRGLSRGTLSITKGILSAALNYAIYPAELISSNPSLAIKLPRTAPRRVTKRTIITPDQLASLLNDFPVGHKYRIPVLLAYHTGARIGEILGLEWQDIDLDKKSIRIRQQLQNCREVQVYFFESPKTESSYRDFYIDSKLVSELKKWKMAQGAARMKRGEAYQLIYEDKDRQAFSLPVSEDCPAGAVYKDLVCTDQTGLFIKYPALSRVLRRYGLNAHSFRHTHTTELAAYGALPTDIAARLGHHDATMVNKLYAHDTEAMKQATVNIIEKSIVRYQ
ncbi:site-specific integrase [Selenomonas ruminantium]|uniref:Phage integrase family protein n=1 Tax=Selenomonas ruminantium TaxID=971 RepID=A0A1H0P3H7_SELRU|nr:site-specific integrase [Selenomonas ruminantium]SDO99514.1 Phage integrase family protein [Selenomonas ruminantium]